MSKNKTDGIRSLQIGMRYACVTVILLAASITPTPGRANEEQGAATLLSEAENLYREIYEADGMESRRRIELLNGILARLDGIVEQYPGSRLAVELVTGRDAGNMLRRSEIKLNLRVLAAVNAAQPEFDASWMKCHGAPTTECLLDRALVLGRGFGREFARRYYLSEMIATLASSGQDGHARKAYAEVLIDVLSIEDQYTHDIRSAGVVQNLGRAGWFREGRLLASKIKDRDERDDAMVHVAGAIAKAGQYGEANKIASTIYSEYTRAEAFTMISVALTEAGKTDEAEKTLVQAILLATISTERHGREFAMNEIARALVAAGRVGDALRRLEDVGDLQTRGYILRDIATIQANKGQFADAYESVALIQDTIIRNSALIDVIEVLAESGRYADAVGKLAANSEDLDPVYVTISRARIEAMGGNFGEALKISKKIEHDVPRVDILLFVSEAMREAGQVAEADIILAGTLETARNSDGDDAVIVALSHVAAAFADAGRREEANAIFAEAFQAMPGIASDGSRDFLLNYTVDKLLE